MKQRFTDGQRLSADHLSAVAALARVVHHGSFTRAAIELGVSTSALSQTIRSLEARAGIRLLNRTTRRVAATVAGQRFLTNAMPALDMLDCAFAELDQERGMPAGTLRINASRAAAEHLVAPMLAQFAQMYPEVVLDMVIDDGLADLASGGFDAGIRLGEQLSPNAVAVPVGPQLSMAVVSSPAYFATHGVPQTPADLAAHRCLRYRFRSNGAIYRWEFTDKRGDFAIDVTGGLIVSDSSMVNAAALSGWGIACALDIYVAAEIAAGRLQRVLQPFCPSFDGFHLYYPHREQMPLKLRIFIDAMKAHWGSRRKRKS
jgi:DNA-binding transcriptional LysR family regulator